MIKPIKLLDLLEVGSVTIIAGTNTRFSMLSSQNELLPICSYLATISGTFLNNTLNPANKLMLKVNYRNTRKN